MGIVVVVVGVVGPVVVGVGVRIGIGIVVVIVACSSWRCFVRYPISTPSHDAMLCIAAACCAAYSSIHTAADCLPRPWKLAWGIYIYIYYTDRRTAADEPQIPKAAAIRYRTNLHEKVLNPILIVMLHEQILDNNVPKN